MEKQALPTRTCLACGLDKPLAAFLQLTGKQGTMYGNICSACRSKSKPSELHDNDEQGSGASGLRIDSKTKVQQERDKKSFQQKRKELNLEELQKKEEDFLIKDEKKELKQKTEREHREEFIETKQKSKPRTETRTSDSLNKIPQEELEKKSMFEQTETREKNLNTQQRESLEKNLNIQQQEVEVQKSDLFQEKEASQDTTDLSSGLMISPSLVGRRFQINDSFLRLQTLLGKTGLLNRIERLYGSPKTHTEKHINTKIFERKKETEIKNAHQSKEAQVNKEKLGGEKNRLSSFGQAQKKTIDKDPLIEFAKENLNPSSRKKR